MGRYLLGLADEADLMPLVTGHAKLSEVAYCFAIRAHGERRFREACDWYRLAADTSTLSDHATFATYALMDWASTAQGIWRVETTKD